jgi:hypothetical protein
MSESNAGASAKEDVAVYRKYAELCIRTGTLLAFSFS